MILPRRSLFAGLGAALAAPAIVRAGNIMPVSSFHQFPKGQEDIELSNAAFCQWPSLQETTYLVGWEARQLNKDKYYFSPIISETQRQKLSFPLPVVVKHFFNNEITIV